MTRLLLIEHAGIVSADLQFTGESASKYPVFFKVNNMNIFEQQAKAIQQVREVGKVIPFPTQEEAKALHARGLTVVHKPHKFKCREFNDDDLPPEAA